MKTNLFFEIKKCFSVIGALSIIMFTGSVFAQQHIVRIYADQQEVHHSGIATGSVDNASNAIDGNPQSFSTINIGFALLGGTESQYLTFSDGIKAGQPVYVKFSTPSSLLSALNALSVGIVEQDGTLVQVYTDASLLALLGGAGTNEIEIIAPSNCNGIYFQLSGGLVSAGLSANLYHAYILDTVDGEAGCPEPIDVLSGVNAAGGLSIANVTSSVANPLNGIDGNITTAATLNIGASVLSETYLSAILNTPAKAGDSVKIILQDNGALLTVNALTNFKIITFSGSSVVDTLKIDPTLLSITLLKGATNVDVLKAMAPHAFDRIEIVFGGIAGVLNSTNIYEISVSIPAPGFTNGISEYYSQQYVYAGNPYNLQAVPNAANDPIVWFDSNGNIANTNIPATTPAGTYNYFALSSRDGCTKNSDTAILNLHIVPFGPPNSPSVGIVGQSYSSDVKITPPPSGSLPNEPQYIYSIVQGSAFSYTNNLKGNYAINYRQLKSGPYNDINALQDNDEVAPGLILNDDGTITGIPTAAGTYNFTMHVEDANNKDASGNNLTVGDFDKTITINAALLIKLKPGSFIASLDNDGNVVLNWATLSEIDALRFDIQRSNDGINFEKVGSVNAVGNSFVERSYNYIDKNAFGKIYYRLKETDINNAAYYSETITIDNEKQNSITISPNPASTYIYINGNVTLVKIFDGNGQLISTNNSNRIDVKNLAAGVYFVNIQQANGSIIKSKFIKR